MSLLVLSPDFASHYRPLAVVAAAASNAGQRVVVATGPGLRTQVEADGFEWRPLRLGAGSNRGVAALDPGLERFISATAAGPVAALRRQALDRGDDLLWRPRRVAADVARLCDEIDPDHVIVDHVAFASTLAMYALGRPFVTLVPGHPSQLPVGTERYGIPTSWPERIRPEPHELAALDELVDRVTEQFTETWNATLAAVAPGRSLVDDAFRVHGDMVLYNSVAAMNLPARSAALPDEHRFVGPLVRREELPRELNTWTTRRDDRPQAFVALGTFLSHRDDVLVRIVEALRRIDVRAAVATGATAPDRLGSVPDDWLVAPRLPQVAMLRSTDVVVHHGGNNSVQEALAAGARQVVLPFSTDQFSNAADLERAGGAIVLSPNDASPAELASALDHQLGAPAPAPVPPVTDRDLVDAAFGVSSREGAGGVI